VRLATRMAHAEKRRIDNQSNRIAYMMEVAADDRRERVTRGAPILMSPLKCESWQHLGTDQILRHQTAHANVFLSHSMSSGKLLQYQSLDSTPSHSPK